MWRRALDEPGWSADPLAIAAAAAEATFSAPADGLPQVERERAALWSFARLVEADSHYGRDWATFLDGWRDLAEIDAQPPEGETSVPAMMKKLDSLFDQPLTFRAAGAFLAAAAAGSGELDRIERTLRFDIDDGRVVNVAG